MQAHLKSLELSGYKTFASRTLFQFADAITAIVGPNGSGKSNIADSIRWVLGEQSYSLLRGKKTEDMIFSGSELRTRAGMASATITFDNSEGWLPIDFSEVAVTRRAYRDGQNEYLINGQRVRLKDISELLAQSGLAERTYTVIGQGLVDAALSLKAEERRRLFEEAAGIGLHRSRREEALHRLETTRRNLERVQDILAELQPRLHSLEKQARRAREYEQVKADLQVLLRDWYGYHWHHAQSELTDAREFVRQRETALERTRQEQAALDEKLSELRGKMQDRRASLNDWHRQSAQFHSRQEGIFRDLAVADERLRSLQTQSQNILIQQVRLEEDIALQRNRYEEVGREILQLEIELQDAQAQAEIAKQALANCQVDRLKVEKDVQVARQALSALNARQGQLQAWLAERQSAVGRARATFESADQAMVAAEKELKTNQARFREAGITMQEAENGRKAAEEALQAHRRKLGEADAAQKEAQDRSTKLSTDIARLEARREVLEQAEKALSGYAAGTRLLLQAAQQARLSGALGPLSRFLNVPGDYEAAIAAALGEYLDAMVLEGDVEPSLDLLADKGERGALLPLSRLIPISPFGGLTKENGILGIATSLVEASPEVAPAVELLLGQTLIVRDRQAVQLALKDQLPGVRAVTLQGEVFFASGQVVAAGAGNNSPGKTILSRQRERKDLIDALGQAEKQAANLDEQLLRFDQEMKELRLEEERLSEAQHLARKQEEKASLAYNQSRLTTDQAGKQLHWQQEQRSRLQEEIIRWESEASQASNELAQLEKEVSTAREQLRQKNNALFSFSLEEFQTQVAHWNTLAAVAGQKLVDGKSRQQERQEALEQAQRTQASFQVRLGEITSAYEALQAEMVQWREVENKFSQEIDSLHNLIEPAEADLEKMDHELEGLQTVDSTARQGLSLAEHHYAQARIALARRQEALDSMRRRIEDDFGLVAFEYAEAVSGPTPLPLGGMVEQLPRLKQLAPEMEDVIKRQRAQLRRMGPVNPEAMAEYHEVRQRYEFLTEQVADLEKAETGIRQVIAELDTLMEHEFRRTFEAVAGEFHEIFTRLFGGGSAHLVLTDPDDLTGTGIDIEARLPGHRTQGLSLLSGGERSLTAAALVFSLLKVSPTPFCVLDEVDAMLDEVNVSRFSDLLRELSQRTQFVVVTHNRNTVQVADVIYGVTMGRDSSSQVLSLKMDEVSQVVD